MISKALMAFSGGDAVEVRVSQGELCYRWEAAERPAPKQHFELVTWPRAEDGRVVPALHEPSDLEWLCWKVARRECAAALPFFTSGGSFWTADAWESLGLAVEVKPETEPEKLCIGGHYRSLAVMRFMVDDSTIGLLHVKAEAPGRFTKTDVERFEGAAQTLGLAMAAWRAQYALRERVKELTCLYGIAHLAERADLSLPELLRLAVNLLPPAWQYPEIAAARIVVDGQSHTTPGFQPVSRQQSAAILVRGRRRGAIEVHYAEERPEFAAGVFLEEEAKLIATVAREVARIVERCDIEREREQLQQQLIHADRLATIGQLAAGVAHELNEPLGGILGFAQLARKCPGLPEPAARDTQKIVTAALYAREVIKKLMLFARPEPARKVPVNLNRVIDDSLYFLAARCAKAGTRIVRELAAELPDVSGDPGQLTQVLVNLVVNAVQAMPDGGTLTLRTCPTDDGAALIVEDTGTGINEEIQARIFLPFFTTKDVNEGTGLGLAVVHGIVTAHGGAIHVQSEPGKGTRFEVRLPANGAKPTQENGPNDDRN